MLEKRDDQMADDPRGPVAREPRAAQLPDLDGERLAAHVADRDHARLVATLVERQRRGAGVLVVVARLDRPPARGGEATNRGGQQSKVRRTL